MGYDMAEKKDKWLYEFKELDQKADALIEDGQTFVDKVKKSKWTPAALVGGLLALALVIFK